MKLLVYSDLHLEFGAKFTVPKCEYDTVVLAGDTHLGTKGVEWASQVFDGKPVVYVAGNHEYYKEDFKRLVSKLKETAQNTNVHVLENDSVVVNGVRFLGTTLWVDFNLFNNRIMSELAVTQYMNDFRVIRVSPSYRPFRASDAANAHATALKFLKQGLNNKHDGQTVVVTHHAPSKKSATERYANDLCTAGYASNLDELVLESGVKLWVHGHMHNHSDYFVGETRVLANPRGYHGFGNSEDTGFEPTLTVDI